MKKSYEVDLCSGSILNKIINFSVPLMLTGMLQLLYNAADVFVMPSRREPFGLVALEAMACGLPVVGSNEGGLPEFINSQVGTLVSPEDEEAFCAAILNELTRHHTEPERRDIIAHYASSNFAQAQFVAKLEQVYQRAVRDFSG